MTNFDLIRGEVLLIDKPKEWTSFDVIRKIQGVTKYKKIGHAGTLDPLATGLLILCTGKKTKQINKFQGLEKEYITEFVLGAVTKSYDAEFEPEDFKDTSDITKGLVEKTINEYFTGEILQVPPIFSAVKINGQRAYKLARNNKEVKLRERAVSIKNFELLDYEKDVLNGKEVVICSTKINCSKGTYIRSLIYDLGQKLKVGGYVKELRRTKIGEYSVEKAWQLEDLIENLKY